MTVSVVHADVSTAEANPNVEIDGPKWNKAHNISQNAPGLIGNTEAGTARVLSQTEALAQLALSTASADIAANTADIATNATAIATNAASITSNAAAIALRAPLASPQLTGTPTAPTATAGTNTTQLATTAFVANALTGGVRSVYDAVIDGGCDNTGATDTSSDLQSAVTAANSAGKTLYIPKGTYTLGDATIALADQTHVIAHPGAELRRTANPSTAAPLFESGSYVSWTGGIVASTLSSAVVSGNNAAFRALGDTGVRVSDMRISGKFYVGLVFDGSTDCIARGVRVDGVKNRALYAYRLCDDILFDGCFVNGYEVGTSTRYTQYGINCNPATTGIQKNIRIIGCGVEHCTSQGIEIGDRCYHSLIVGNTIEDIGFYGILVQKANGYSPQWTTVQGNVTTDCDDYGIYLIEANYASVDGNIVYNNSDDGIRAVGCQYCAITTNQVTNNGNHGIVIGATATPASGVRNRVIGNSSVSNADTGIMIENAGDQINIIALNTVHNNTTGQITDNGTSNTVKDNTVT